MIAIVDYGLGNVRAFANIYKRLGFEASLARTAAELSPASHIILPGVGAFDWAMEKLDASGMRATLDDMVLRGNKPVLGVCVGMQIMAGRSDEGSSRGLGWFDAEVKLFDRTRMRPGEGLPHMGWNDVALSRDDRLFGGMEGPARFYFLHSYYFAAGNADDVLGTADYGGRFACAVRRGNVIGVQFHPEKSHGWGVRLLRNFAEV